MPVDIKKKIIPVNTEIYLLRIKDNAFFLIDTGVEQITGEVTEFRGRKFDKKGEADPVLVHENVPVTFRIAVEYAYTVVVVFDIELLDFLHQRSFDSITGYLLEIDIYRQVKKTPVFVVVETIFFLARILVLTGLLQYIYVVEIGPPIISGFLGEQGEFHGADIIIRDTVPDTYKISIHDNLRGYNTTQLDLAEN